MVGQEQVIQDILDILNNNNDVGTLDIYFGEGNQIELEE